jgi:SAM-dependent methyltransferase
MSKPQIADASTSEPVPAHLLSILRSPVSRLPLTAHAGSLETVGSWPAQRYTVQHGIPILLDDALDRLHSQEEGIVRSFELSSEWYYSRNYAGLERPERMLRYERVIELIGSLSSAGLLVADVGSGPAVFAEPIQALGAAYVAIDLSLHNLLAARRRLAHFDAVVGSVTDLPVRDEAFDLVLCIGCLEYVTRPQRALAELLRVTRGGGYLLMSFANSHSPRRWWEEGAVHRAARLRSRLLRRPDGYRRSLAAPAKAMSLVTDSGGKVELIEYLGQGLFGYPLSEWRWSRDLAAKLQDRSDALAKRSSEFLLLASRRP